MLIVKLIIKFLLSLYLATSLSVIGHELAHYVTAKVLGFSEVFLCIGFGDFCGIKTKNLFISPLAFSGYVEYNTQEDRFIPMYNLFFFYFSGVVFNAILIAIAVLLKCHILTVVNAIMIIISLLPFNFTKSDLSSFIQICKSEG